MISILALTTNNKKGVLFTDPLIENKDTILFNETSVGLKGYFKKNNNYVELNINGKYIPLNIDSDDIEILNDFHSKEYEKVNSFYLQLAKKEIDLMVSEDNMVNIKELIDNAFNPYYVKILIFQINKLLKINITTMEEFEAEIIKRIDISKYSLTENEYGKNYIVPLKDIL